jgi:hypothetical protein
VALEFSDWGLTPEEKVASQKKAMEDYTNIAQPALKQQEALEKGKLAQDVYSQTTQAAKAGTTQAISPIISKAQAQAATLIPQQKTRAQEMAAQGAQYQEGILGTKQAAAVGDYERNTMVYKDKAAKMLADKAFAQGYSAKELTMSMNGTIADRGFEQAKEDFDAGRISKEEVQAIVNNLASQANQMQLQLKEDLSKLRGELEHDLSIRDYNAAQNRMEVLRKRQQEASETAAKAGNWASIMNGTFKIGVATVGAAVSKK